MSVSMHQASVPVFTQALTNLAFVLKKGESAAQDLRTTPELLLQRALIADMFSLTKQVQRACDTAARSMARLAGVQPKPFPDNETSFAELYRRIDSTIDYVGSFTATQIDGSEKRTLDVELGGHQLQLSGYQLLFRYAIPNLFFHCTTAYDILRSAGVQVGKRNFLGNLLQ